MPSMSTLGFVKVDSRCGDGILAGVREIRGAGNKKE